MNTNPHLEVIIGTMFSGKSTELIRRANRYEIAGLHVQLFKSKVDDRYGKEFVKSHDGLQRGVIYVEGMNDLRNNLHADTNVIGIDEVQFLESGVVDFCDFYANQGKIVIAAGLLKDFRDELFLFADKKKTMADLLSKADNITTLKALCMYKDQGKICGQEASRVQRFVDEKIAPYDDPTVLVDGTKSYSPRCRRHFQFYTMNHSPEQ